MKKLRCFMIISVLIFCAAVLFAQNQKVVLAFFEDASGDFRIVSADGADERYGDQLEFGSEIPVGWTVVTGNGDSAELQLEPTKTIIRVAENTNFHIDGLQGLAGAEESRFSLGFGKIRCVAGKIVGDEKYVFNGQAAACGVRGTDWQQWIGQAIDGTAFEEVLVFAGQIEYSLLADPLKKILVKAGEFANALADSFESLIASAQKIADAKKEMLFQELDPEKVPKLETGVEPKTPAPEEVTELEKQPPEEGIKEPGQEPKGYLTQMLQDIIGFEIGSITIGNETYAKAVATPTFSVGKLAMSLYLPIIYSQNLLDPDDWYKPNGNSEWSFGFDQGGDWWAFTKDFAYDLFLKIKYVQWGDIRDPFFFKVGNLNSFTVGHGLIMRNYANDDEFPAIRRIGVNFGLDLGGFGFETVVNDLADPLVFGGRVYVRPFAGSFPLALGLSSVVDIGPAVLQNPDIAFSDFGSPVIISAGLDLDFPIVERDLLSIILFGDVAGMIPYFTTDGLDPAITRGLAWQTLFDTSDGFKIRNIGAVAGLFGNMGPVDWRLEFRWYNGAFEPAMFDSQYERHRVTMTQETAAYAADPGAVTTTNMGIHGRAGWGIPDIFTLKAGYTWPWIYEGGKLSTAEEDEVFLSAVLERGVIPAVDIGAEVSYERSYFIPWLFEGATASGYDLKFFDAYTGLKTKVTYGVSENIDLLLFITTTLQRNPDGTVYFDPATYLPKLVNSFSFETQVHF